MKVAAAPAATTTSDPHHAHVRTRRQSRTVEGPDGIVFVPEAEKVPENEFSEKLMQELREEIASSPELALGQLLQLAAQLALATVLWTLMLVACWWIPIGDPSLPYGSTGSLLFSFVFWPLVSFVVYMSLVHLLVCLVNVPLPWQSRLLAGVAGSCTCTGINALLATSGVFPVPYLLFVGGVPGALSLQLVMYFCYPRALRTKWGFRRELMGATVITWVNVVSALLLLLYNAAFAQSEGATQSALALLLPVAKWLVRTASKFGTSQGGNPDFAHGAGFFAECCTGAISAVIFTSIQDVSTFVFLVLIDVSENFFHFTRVVYLWGDEKDKRLHEVFASLTEASQDLNIARQASFNMRLAAGGGAKMNLGKHGAVTREPDDEDLPHSSPFCIQPRKWSIIRCPCTCIAAPTAARELLHSHHLLLYAHHPCVGAPPHGATCIAAATAVSAPAATAR